MSERQFDLITQKRVSHNVITITPVEDTLRIVAIIGAMSDGTETLILKNPVEIHGVTIFRYPITSSGTIKLVIEHELAGSLEFNDLATVQVALDYYEEVGTFTSEEEILAFNENVSVFHDIQSIQDTLFKLNVHIHTKDNFDNYIYGGIVPISINNDGYMVASGYSGSEIVLDYIPSSDIKILSADGEVDNFRVEGARVLFDIPEGFLCLVVYKPQFILDGVMAEVTENITVTPDYGIKLRDSYCNNIFFSMSIEVYNTNLVNINSTPIIQGLGLTSSNN